MERLLLWFLEGLAEGQGGPQARRREAPPKRTGGPLARRSGGRPAARLAPCGDPKRAYRRGLDIGHQRFAGI